MRNPVPLPDALIQPAPGVYPVDKSTEALYRRSNAERDRVLPTARTTQGHPGWRWRPTDAPSNSGAPKIMGPSELEQRRPEAAPDRPSIRDVVRRLRP